MLSGVAWMYVYFVMMHYSFSSGTHGKVFTKPSAKITRLNWADVQLLRKWMLFKGASQCCTPVSVKGPSLSFSSLSFSSSLHACVSEAHQSHTTVRCDECSFLKENHRYLLCVIQCTCLCVCLYWTFKHKSLLCSVDFMSLISALNYNKTTNACGHSKSLISEQT